MKQTSNKTNVMRILEQKNINFKSYSYTDTDAISGIDVANVLNQNPNQVFKTLVTVGNTKINYVFLIPVNGGCSPIGMKKQFKTIIDVSAKDFKTIIFSGGKIGYQVEVSLDDLRKIIDFELVDIQTIKNN